MLLLLLSPLVMAEAPDAAHQAQVHDFGIEAQAMQTALNRFSEQSDMRILFPYRDVKGLRSNAVKGRMSTRHALECMIAGTRLRITSMRDNVVVLRLADLDVANTREATPTDGSVPAGPILVTGRRISRADEAIGEGHARHSAGVTRKALLSAPPGISGLKMLEYLPGFNVQTDGPLGLYEFGNSVQTRAFNLNQIGFVVDGIPLGRSDAFGGSPVFRYVDNENLAAVEASPGAGDVGTPSYSSLGPMISYRSIEPDRKAGVFVAQSFGSDALRRTFVRLSSGDIGPLRGYVSHTRLSSDLWRGAGTIDRKHWEGQILADLTAHSWLRFKFAANDFFDYDSPFLYRDDYLSATPDLGGRTGRDRGYIGFVPDLPETVAGVRYSNPDHAYYYGNAINARNDKLYGATLHVEGEAPAFAEVTLYREDKHGFGVSPDTYENSLLYHDRQAAAGLSVTAPRGLQWGYSGVDGQRQGVVLHAEATRGDHRFDAGVWVENDRYHRSQYRLNKTDGAPDGAVLADEIVYYRRNYRSHRDAVQFWARDRWTPGQGPLTLELGFKGLDISYRLDGYRDFDDYAHADGSAGWGAAKGRAHYFDGFEPSAGIVYRMPDTRTELFASYAETMALPKAMDTIASTAFAASAAFAPKPQAERARNMEIGLRTSQPRFFAVATLYHTRFANLISPVSGPVPGTTGAMETYFRNVGAVEAHGLEMSASVKPALLDDKVYFTTNLTYNDATFQNDLPDGTAIASNRIPDSALWIASGTVTVEPTPWALTSITAKYTSRRYADYLNTQSVGGQWIVDAYVELGRETELGPLRNAHARINIDNLFDADTLSFIFPTVSGEAAFRPLSPRTVQLTFTGEF
ncbi:TonB-dependent receptor domain-containing protein [Novosphingobium mangrovi (ex Huang et al. 2023)]|uniref:TonB-dependent receptor n=1 Tax=Novosphingobium mangrovi (ex Huang et al. 2023) TaxID=2976432 RepID=A0ABT2I833_9SPHN|nr:TonB-dependent receptor [Novosphingobium mangrovi (ex Huang et al. 2023)]MCT2400939.1 TonB-dependent receptor [Novosphingobium mangrovi (ex Huang et al. 2023)]